MMLWDDQHTGSEGAPTGSISGHLDEWEEAAVDYLDGALDAQTAAAVEAHLRNCPTCAARLRTQQGLVSFLEDIDYEEPPSSLEDRVLGELLFPSKPVAETERLEEGAPSQSTPSRWSAIWHRRIVQWVPVTVAVVALLGAVVTYGVVRSGGNDSRDMAEVATTAAGLAAKEADGALEESATVSTTAAPATTTAMLGAGSVPAATDGSVTTTGALTYATPAAGATLDKEAMVAGLEAASAPAYFVFETYTAPPAGTGADDGVSASIAAQITALTGLQPLDQALWLDGPTFAAYLPREDAKPLVDLLFSIGSSFETTLALAQQPLAGRGSDARPAADETDTVSHILERKAEFPELSADRTPPPAVNSWSFTTSTSLPVNSQSGQVETPLSPGATDARVLVVIYVQR